MELQRQNLVTGGVHLTRPRVLVTGGTGFLGRPLVRRLLADGYPVRLLARRRAGVENALPSNAEVSWGDVADLETFGRALAGCDLVVHLAAGTSGSERDNRTATLQGTRNLLELCRRYRPRRLVYISSCSVYGVADYASGALVSETASLERFPDLRGSYTASKLEAERYVREFMASGQVPTVILRPAAIYGPEGALFTAMMGFSFRSLYVVIDVGGFVLPLVYVDNVVDAIMLSLEKEAASGRTFNVVDSERIDKRTYMNGVVRRANPGARVVYFPYYLLYGLAWLQERMFQLMKKPPVLRCYRLASSQRNVVYDARHIAECLGWRPRVSATEAMDRVVAWQLSRRKKEDVDMPPSGLLHTVTAGRPVERDSVR
jgi:nucleoside-diphosphate-sugar epimerase